MVYLTPHPTRRAFYREGIGFYVRRIRQLWPSFTYSELGGGRAADPVRAADEAARQVRHHLEGGDWVVLLDERGPLYTTSELLQQWEQWIQRSARRLVFVSGGPYGFPPQFRDSIQEMVALSPLTLPHELARLVWLEQLYRILTLWKGMPYHH